MDCPVCPKRDIPEGLDHCPNCSVDLKPLRKIQDFRREMATQTERRTVPLAWSLIVIPALCAGFFAVGTFIGKSRSSAPVQTATATHVGAASRPTGDQTVNRVLAALKELDGVRAKKEGEAVIVQFNQGLFSAGSCILRAEAKSVIKRCIESVLSLDSPEQIVVEGHTDNTPVTGTGSYKNNWQVGMARSTSVVEFLLENFNGLSGRLFAVSRGEGDSPFPNDTEKTRKRNRTVVMRIEFK